MARKNYSGILSAPVAQTVRTAPEQVKNSAGGYVYQTTDWEQLQRFLILGSSEPNYYFGAQKLTKLNVDAVVRCIKHDGAKVVEECVFIRGTNRAVKVDSVIFTLALCVKHGTPEVKQAALRCLWKVAQTGTQLFQFVAECEGLGVGWGRMFRAAVADWYTEKPVDKLAYQAVKYQQRDGWSHRDLLRLAHVKPEGDHAQVLAWIAGKIVGPGKLEGGQMMSMTLPAIIEGYSMAKDADAKRCAELVRMYGLTREMLPTTVLNDKDVWAALLDKMPMTAMVRNLGKMTSVGLMDDAASRAIVTGRLSDAERIAKARIHPLTYFVALKTYAQGHGTKGSLKWEVKSGIVDALDEAVRLSFGTLPKINKRIRVAVDYSGSMQGSKCMDGIMPLHEASAVMARAFMHQSDDVDVMGFGSAYRWLSASKGQRIDDLAQMFFVEPEGTNMGLAYVTERPADLIVVFTDNETWDGVHCDQAWAAFTRANKGAKTVVLSMTANNFNALPTHPDVLNCAGFDTSAPQVVAAFAGFGNPETAEDE